MFTLAPKMCSVMNAAARGNDAPLLQTPSSTKDAFSPLPANFLHTSRTSPVFSFFLLSLLFYFPSSSFRASSPGTISKANNKLPQPPPTTTNLAVTSARVSRASVSCADNCLFFFAPMNHHPRHARPPLTPHHHHP